MVPQGAVLALAGAFQGAWRTHGRPQACPSTYLAGKALARERKSTSPRLTSCVLAISFGMHFCCI